MKKLTQADFQERRDILAGEMGLRSIAVIATSKEAMRNRDADYKFRADSSFFYLTGFAEPEAVAVIETFDTEEEGYTYSLFCRERNREMEIWNGYRAGIDGAIEDYEADEAYAIDLLDEEILEKLQNKDKLFYRIGQQADFDARVAQWIAQANGESRRGNSAPAQVIQLDRIVDEMRLHKSEDELEMMQIASDISAEAHTRAMQTVKPGMMEYALEAELNYVFGKNGCVPSYNSIVGGGENGCILHYVENDKELKDGDLVLIDAACEYPDGEEKDILISLIANHMKKLIFSINKDGVEDEKILKDLCEYSKGKINLDPATYQLHEFKEAPAAPTTTSKKSKKKK